MKVSVIAGGAGFVGVNLLGRLLLEPDRHVVILDNMSRGKSEFVQARMMGRSNADVLMCDCADPVKLDQAFAFAATKGEIDEIWHLAANSDIPAGVLNASVDLQDTFMTTFQILQAMKKFNILSLHFASSSAIYGDLGGAVLHEAIGPVLPISNYGAMKLASEALISAAAESYLKCANMFRFPNVVGVPATHGVILDFVNKLKNNPAQLQVLGNGTQQKSYLHVSDLVDAMLFIRECNRSKKVDVINIGPTDEGVTVKWIAEQVVQRVQPDAAIAYGTESRGWVGDVPKFVYSTAKLQALGWQPRLDSAAAVTLAIDEISSQAGC